MTNLKLSYYFFSHILYVTGYTSYFVLMKAITIAKQILMAEILDYSTLILLREGLLQKNFFG